MTEIWKDIPGFENRYQASNLGRIRSVDRYEHFSEYVRLDGKKRKASVRFMKGRILRPAPNTGNSGHLAVVLGRKAGTKDVHALIAKAFLGLPLKGQEVMHLDHNPTNNRVDNLKYGTRGENIAMDYEAGTRDRNGIRTIRAEILKRSKG